MGRLFGSGDSFTNTSFAPLGAPFSWSGWIYPTELPTTTGDEHNYFFLSDNTFNNFFSLRGDDGSSNTLQMNRRASGATQSAQTGNTLNVNEWNHIFGSCIINNSATSILNGDTANAGSNAVAVTPLGIDRIVIGASVATDFHRGRMAHMAMWDVELTTAEAVALASGVSPLRIRPQNLVHYWPMFSTNLGNAIDYGLNKDDLTEGGTIDAAPDPPVAPPFGFDISFVSTGAAVAPVQGDGNNIIFF